jgi:hypothetical protein
MSSSVQKPARPLGIVTLAAALALVSATGRPEPESLAVFTGAGLPPVAATLAVHAIPVVAAVIALLAGRILGRNRSPGVKWIIYALSGMAVGMLTAWHLELFAGVPGMIESMNGPLAEAAPTELVLWGLGAVCIMMGLLVGLVAAFGTQAATALQVEEMDPELLEVRAHERSTFAMSAIGMATLGIACMALAVARQSLPDMRIGPIAIALAAAFASVALNYALWRRCDEMQRRVVVNGYACSAIVVTLGSFGWALGQSLGALPPLEATVTFLALITVQIVATAWVMSVVAGNAFGAAKPA